jgi:hypothetical protein
MPAPSDSAARVGNVRTRSPAANAAPLRPSAPVAPAAPAGPARARDEYDDDGDTALFNHGSPAMAQIRGRRSAPPTPDNDTLQSARQSPAPAYDAYRDAMAQAKATSRDLVAPTPEPYDDAIQPAQLRGRQDEAATLQEQAPAQPYPAPMAPRVDPFPTAPPLGGAMPGQATMPPGWGPNQAPLAPPPRSPTGALLLLASLGFLALASAALWYVLHAAR